MSLETKYEYMMETIGYFFCPRYDYILTRLELTMKDEKKLQFEEAMKQYQECRYYVYDLYSKPQAHFPFFRGAYILDKFIEKWLTVHPEDKDRISRLRNELMLSDEAIKKIDGQSPKLPHLEKVEQMNAIFLPQVDAYTISEQEIRADYKVHPEWFL